MERKELDAGSQPSAAPHPLRASHTPGPWRWEINLKSRQLQLCGGRPLFDLTVMDFRRWGMGGAQPRFLVPHPSGGMLLHEAHEFAKAVPGREHHAHWFQAIDHPDADLIAAAPELLGALKRCVREMRGTISFTHEFDDALAAADAALSKAGA